MKPLLLVLSTIMLLTLAGWGQTAAGQQANASVAAHRREAKEHPARHRQSRRHRHRHRGHGKA